MSTNSLDVRDVPLKEILCDELFNGRDPISLESVAQLAMLIQENDWISPIDLRPMDEVPNPDPNYKYIIRSGHRRFKACKLLERETIPALIIRGEDQNQAQLLNFIENDARLNLKLVESARVIRSIFPMGTPISTIARKLGHTEEWVKFRLNLLTLPPWVLEREDEFSEADFKAILRNPYPNEKAIAILKARRDGTYRKKFKAHTRIKSEVRELMKQLLAENYNPKFVRLLAWAIGDASEEALEETLEWLDGRKPWLQ